MRSKPRHALSAVLECGVAVWTWPATADFLNSQNLRTSKRRRWTAVNVRVHFHNIVTHELKLARGRAIERGRGLRSSYLEQLRKTIPASDLAL